MFVLLLLLLLFGCTGGDLAVDEVELMLLFIRVTVDIDDEEDDVEYWPPLFIFSLMLS